MAFIPDKSYVLLIVNLCMVLLCEAFASLQNQVTYICVHTCVST